MAATIYYEFSGGTGDYTAELITGLTTVVDLQIHVSAGAYSFTGVVDGIYDIVIIDSNACEIEKFDVIVICTSP